MSAATLYDKLMRPSLRGFTAYSSARTEAEGTVSIALDANESPWPPFGAFAAKIAANRYPDPQPAALLAKLAALTGARPDQVLIGRGSDEAIDVLVRLFCEAGQDQIMICPPTYGMYEIAAGIQGAEVLRVPLQAATGYRLDVAAVLAAATPRTKLIFIPSPNAPMGHPMDRQAVLDLCAARADESLIVVDEAYIDFSADPAGFVPFIGQVPNLVVLRTLSKSYAMAGERVGMVIGDTALIGALRRILAPYPLTQSSIAVAMEALSPTGLLENAARRAVLIAERERMAAALQTSPFVTRLYPSQGNFLFLVVTDAAALMTRLETLGIRIRARTSVMENAVRISIGAPEENDLVLRALHVPLPAPAQSPRLFSVRRTTKETDISVCVDLDRPAFCQISTGIGFFDHMLAQIGVHGGIGLGIEAKGDLETGDHHTIEDCALALGEALRGALGDKRGIGRYGFWVPLDEALAEVVIDLSGRPVAVFEGRFNIDRVQDMDCEMVPHFFRSLATSLQAAVHVRMKAENAHHGIEACFKGFGRALRQAMATDGSGALPSSKGAL